jgi:hypothetical protein
MCAAWHGVVQVGMGQPTASTGESNTLPLWRAADAPGTKRVMRHRWIAGGTIGVVGVALIVIGSLVRISDIRAHQAESTGRDPHAVVTRVVSQPGGRGPGSTILTVRFHDLSGVAHTGQLTLDRSAGGRAVGSTVTVEFDAHDPSRFSVVGEETGSAPIPWLVVSVLGVVMIGIAVVAATWLRWTSGVLRDNPWVVVESRVIERATSDDSRLILRVLELRGAPDEHTLAMPLSWRAQSLDEFAPTAWVAGSGRRFVVAVSGGAGIHRFRRVRLIGERADPSDGVALPSRHAVRG